MGSFVTGSHITHYILPKKRDLPLPPSFFHTLQME